MQVFEGSADSGPSLACACIKIDHSSNFADFLKTLNFAFNTNFFCCFSKYYETEGVMETITTDFLTLTWVFQGPKWCFWCNKIGKLANVAISPEILPSISTFVSH